MSFPLHDPSRPPSTRPPSVRPPSSFMRTPTPAPASAPPMQTGQTKLEAMLDTYVSPLTRLRPEAVASFISAAIGPCQPPESPGYQQFAVRRHNNWHPFLRFVAARQMQDVTEVPKLLEIVRRLTEGGSLDTAFTAQSMMEAYNAYGSHIICANRLYGFSLLLQGCGLMLQTEFPTPPPEAPGALQMFFATARPPA